MMYKNWLDTWCRGREHCDKWPEHLSGKPEILFTTLFPEKKRGSDAHDSVFHPKPDIPDQQVESDMNLRHNTVLGQLYLHLPTMYLQNMRWTFWQRDGSPMSDSWGPFGTVKCCTEEGYDDRHIHFYENCWTIKRACKGLVDPRDAPTPLSRGDG